MKEKFLLIAIVLLALILRFYNLGNIPLSLNWDEVSNGYNAYSILKTTRDQYGNLLPLYNRSFDDYKPPLYMYSNVISESIFGLNPFALRLPSAVFGTLTVVIMFSFAKIITSSKRVSYLSTFLLAIAPWHLQFSRAGFEANIGLFFTVLGFWILVWLIKRRATISGKVQLTLLLLSAMAISASLYSYHAQRIFTPIFLITLVLIYKKEIVNFTKFQVATFIAVVVFFLLPIFLFLPKEALTHRLEVTSSELTSQFSEKSAKFIAQDENGNKIASKIIHNKKIVATLQYFENYLQNFSPNFLFIEGDGNLRHHIKNMGMFYIFHLPLVLTGIYLIFRNFNKDYKFLLAWTVLSTFPSAFSAETPHAIRSFTIIIPLVIISAIAVVKIHHFLKENRRYFLLIVTLTLYLSLFLYLHDYYLHYPLESASLWQYGYQEAVLESAKLSSDFEKVNIDFDVEQAYIFWLFHTRYNPKDYQQKGSIAGFENYNFGVNVSDFEQKRPSRELLVTKAENFPANMILVKTIYYEDQKEALKIGYFSKE